MQKILSHLCEKFIKSFVIVIKMPFYAVAKGRTTGIFMTWPDCESQVKGYPGARYKKFDNVVAAQVFISSYSGSSNTKTIQSDSLNNLKRPLSLFNSEQPKTLPAQSQQKSTPSHNETTIENISDNSDDLDVILSKQMDDIEKRLKTIEKGVDKIVKKGTRKSILIEPPQNKRQKTNGQEFDMDKDGFVQVYTDGACSSNGRSGARAGLGVYWGDGHVLNISEPVSGRATNNCGEIQAATRAIKQALQSGVQKLSINTDSKFLINSVTKWMPGWKQKGWKLRSGEPVKNEKDFKDLDSVQNKLEIKWNYVEAHKGVHGNEIADQLAKEGAAMYKT